MSDNNNSVPPSGGTPAQDPPDSQKSANELPMLRMSAYIQKHPLVPLLFVAAIALIILGDHLNWMDFRVSGTWVILIAAFSFLIVKKRGEAWQLIKAHKILTFFLIACLPLAMPFIWSYYGRIATANYDRLTDPSKLYVSYQVNLEDFEDEDDKKTLQTLNPLTEKGELMASNILSAGWQAGIKADEVSAFDPTKLDSDDESYTLILFQSIVEKKELPPDPDKPDDPPKVEKKAKLYVCFFPPKDLGTSDKADEDKGDEEEDEDSEKRWRPKKSKAPKKTTKASTDGLQPRIECKEAVDLQVNFLFLATGFAKSRGVDLKLDGLGELMTGRPVEPAKVRESSSKGKDKK